jgi:FKBP-type peptidyl-prolyl cis-trans isomerase
MNQMKKIIYLLFLSTTLFSCLDSDDSGPYKGKFPDMYNETEAEERAEFEKYVSSNMQAGEVKLENLDMTFLSIKEGTADSLVKDSDTLLLAYKVYMLGAKDSVLYNTYKGGNETGLYIPEIKHAVNQATGIKEAVKKMKVGGKAKFVIPSWYLYRNFSNEYGIPQYSTTVWEIEVLARGNNYLYLDNEKKLLDDYFAKLGTPITEVDTVLLGADGATKDSVETSYYFYIANEGDLTNKPDSNYACQVNYKGHYWDGTVFDSSFDYNENDTLSKPLPFYLFNSSLLSGFEKAVAKIGKGGKVFVGIPSELGYKNADNKVHKYNPIFFEIDLISVEERKQQ